jgi:hypothetical protein
VSVIRGAVSTKGAEVLSAYRYPLKLAVKVWFPPLRLNCVVRLPGWVDWPVMVETKAPLSTNFSVVGAVTGAGDIVAVRSTPPRMFVELSVIVVVLLTVCVKAGEVLLL